MQDHSHKLLFLAATGAMCAAVLYGSHAVTALPLPQAGVAAQPGAMQLGFPDNAGASRLSGSAGTSVLPERAGATVLPEKAGASVLPNSASCPAASALTSPPRANEAPAGAPSASAQVHTDANLGTGSACPQFRADAAKSGAPVLRGLAPGQPAQTPATTAPAHP
jgi:hypothetical protein